MSTIDVMGRCYDCGSTILMVNQETASKDGWERWECQGCKRYVSITLEGVIVAEGITKLEGSPPTRVTYIPLGKAEEKPE